MTPHPARIQRKRIKGFNLQAASPNGLPVVYVGRPSRWGNAWYAKDFGVDFAYARYAEHCQVLKENYSGAYEEWIAPLRGKNLACWCKLTDKCHADILLELANL